MKKCLLLIAGIPEWTTYRNLPDGSRTIHEYVRLEHVMRKWLLTIFDANPNVEFIPVISFDSSFYSPSALSQEQSTNKEFTREFVPFEQSNNFLAHAMSADNCWQGLKCTDMPFKDHQAYWKLPPGCPEGEGATYNSPNLMPYKRIAKALKMDDAQDCDYFIYLRPDSYTRRKVFLHNFDNKISIMHPGDGYGGLLFNNKDFDYMWVGDMKVVRKFLPAWMGNSIIHSTHEPIHHPMSEEQKLKICKDYDLFGFQFRDIAAAYPAYTEWHHKLLIDTENYWYSCIQYILDEGHEFETSYNNGVYCATRRHMFEPRGAGDFRGTKPW